MTNRLQFSLRSIEAYIELPCKRFSQKGCCKMEKYEADLEKLFKDAEEIEKQAKRALTRVYSRNRLEWTEGRGNPIKGLKGDIYVKVLGKYLHEKLGRSPVTRRKWARAE